MHYDVVMLCNFAMGTYTDSGLNTFITFSLHAVSS